MFGIGSAYGKFGELLQGALPGEDRHFLISVPTNRYSVAKFLCTNLNTNTNNYPPHKLKSAFLAAKIMQHFKLDYDWQLELKSELVEGKGLGSSTADLVACSRAIVNATGKKLPMDIFLSFLKDIEPSDGIMYDGIVCFYHRQVVLHSQLGFLPSLTIAGIDEGGVIDTISFNQNLRRYTPVEKKNYANLLKKMLEAININDLKTIGDISMQSALIHQDFNPKKNLEYLIEIYKTIDAVGIIVAHSGTYAGILLEKNHPLYSEQLSYIYNKTKERSLSLEVFDTLTEAHPKMAA